MCFDVNIHLINKLRMKILETWGSDRKDRFWKIEKFSAVEV